MLEKLKNLIQTIGNIIMPQSEEASLVNQLSSGQIFEKSKKFPQISKDEISIFDYKDPLVKNIIWQIKYKNNKDATKKIAEICHDFFVDIASESVFNGEFEKLIVVPIPISKTRKNERGFNQCEVILESVKRLDNDEILEIETNNLIKLNNTENQTHLTKSERENNLRGSFKIVDPSKFNNKIIIIFDDIITTGSTMKEAETLLKKCKPKRIIKFSVAHG
jgi:ComF family protein